MDKSLFILGVFLLVLAGILLILSFSDGLRSEAKNTETNFFVGGMIGPIPIGFSNSREMFYVGLGVMILLTIVMTVISKIKLGS